MSEEWIFTRRSRAIPRSGVGTRLTVTMQGTAVSAEPGGQTFAHPFRPALSGSHVTLSLGTVEGRVPTINGVPLSNSSPPRLQLDAAKANTNGESWVCVEVHPSADGQLAPESKVEIVHTSEIRSIDPLLGRGELCMILWRDRRPFKALPIAMFNLRYERVMPPPGAGTVRHLFL